jgi:hypothetical protein
MNPDEIKQRLDEVDAKLRVKLAELGFTPDEIERQLDRSIPDDIKQAEREQILARKFVTDLADPNSGLMDAIIEKAAGDLEEKLAAEHARRRQKRIKLAIGAAVAVAAIAIAIWYFVLRDTTSSCAKLVGPIAELEQLTGVQLELRSGYQSKYYSCYQYVDRRGRAGGSVVSLEAADILAFDTWTSAQSGRKFIAHESFSTGFGKAELYVAGDTPKASPEEMLAEAQSRVGTTSDPMGSVLASLPPSQHVVLLVTGTSRDTFKAVKLSLDRELFSVESAKAYATAVAKRGQ